MRSVIVWVWLVLSVSACGTTGTAQGPGGTPEPEVQGDVHILQLEEKARLLVETSQKLSDLQQTHDEQKARLMRICTDYPDHEVCQPQTAAKYAREAFCRDRTFTDHVDEVVSSCHRGQCKQVDEAHLLERAQYMTLVQRLPHMLVLFKSADTSLDKTDQKRLQQFVEMVHAADGYVIVVGRASRDGSWKQNLRLALNRAENTRKYVVEQLGIGQERVGYITYGHEKMYLTQLDAERLTTQKVSVTQANRSALVFSYPCFNKPEAAK